MSSDCQIFYAPLIWMNEGDWSIQGGTSVRTMMLRSAYRLGCIQVPSPNAEAGDEPTEFRHDNVHIFSLTSQHNRYGTSYVDMDPPAILACRSSPNCRLPSAATARPAVVCSSNVGDWIAHSQHMYLVVCRQSWSIFILSKKTTFVAKI